MVKRVFDFVYKEVRGLHQAAFVLALFAFGSQVLAVVRDRLLAHSFGAGTELDLYYAAFRIPDLLYVLFASVLSVYVLLPFVNRFTAKDGPKAGGRVLSQVFSLFLIIYASVALVLMFAAPVYLPMLFPGLAEDMSTLVLLAQILLLQPFLLGLSSLCGVVTQMSQRFILYAISPLLYNIGIIVGIIFFYPIFGLPGLVVGVVLGALGHFGVQLPFVFRSDYKFSLTSSFDWPLIKEVLFVSVPRAFTLSVSQLVLLVLVGMATVMTAGSVSVFQFAYNLQSVPLAIIGMSYSVAAFPTLSILYAQKDQQGFNVQLLTALRHIIFWSVPIIGLVIVLRAQIVRVLLGSGAFDWGDTRLTAAVLAVFILSLTAESILLLLTRAFYACGRTFIPLWIAATSAAVAIFLAGVFREVYRTHSVIQDTVARWLRLEDVTGTEILVLIAAFVIGQLLQLSLMIFVSRNVFVIRYRSLLVLFTQALIATLAGAGAAYGTLSFIVNGINQETFVGILLQGAAAGIVGLGVVVFVYWFLKAPELGELYRSFRGKLQKSAVVAPQSDTL
ncbi:MAG: lipid II flippase MurJ [Patescibacteria group bacterium]